MDVKLKYLPGRLEHWRGYGLTAGPKLNNHRSALQLFGSNATLISANRPAGPAANESLLENWGLFDGAPVHGHAPFAVGVPGGTATRPR